MGKMKELFMELQQDSSFDYAPTEEDYFHSKAYQRMVNHYKEKDQVKKGGF